MMAIRLVRRDAFLDRRDEGCLEVCWLRHRSDLVLRVSGLRPAERLTKAFGTLELGRPHRTRRYQRWRIRGSHVNTRKNSDIRRGRTDESIRTIVANVTTGNSKRIVYFGLSETARKKLHHMTGRETYSKLTASGRGVSQGYMFMVFAQTSRVIIGSSQ